MFVQAMARRRFRAVAGAVAVVCLMAAAAVQVAMPARAAGPPFPVWLQQLDSCRQALPGGSYTMSGAGFTSTQPANGGTKTVIPNPNPPPAPPPACPQVRGNCTAVSVGCITFNVPAAGTYTITMAASPAPDNSNPLGYAACDGGSACRSETATVTVDATGLVTSATTDSLDPANSHATSPPTGSFAGTQADPVLFHAFGLGLVTCSHETPADNDVDDSLTGTPGSHCGWTPENAEDNSVYPWAHTLAAPTAMATSVTFSTNPINLPNDGASSGVAAVSLGGAQFAGAPVTFTTNGDAKFMPATVVADSTGLAETKIVAGTAAGQQTITATTPGTPNPVTGSATLNQAPPAPPPPTGPPPPAPYLAGAQGTDNQLWVTQGGGHGFAPLGGVLAGAPAIVWVPGPGGGAYEYIVTGTDSQLWTRTDASGWQHLSSATIFCIDNPAAVVTGSTGHTVLTVACQGSDRQLYASSAPVTAGSLPAFGGFGALGGVLTAGPAAAVVHGAITFFVTGTDSHIYVRTLSAGFLPMAWMCTGHPAAARARSATFFGCHGTDGQLWYASNAGRGWTNAVPAGGALIDGPGAAELGSDATFFVEGSNSGMWEITVGAVSPVSGWRFDGGVLQKGASAT